MDSLKLAVPDALSAIVVPRKALHGVHCFHIMWRGRRTPGSPDRPTCAGSGWGGSRSCAATAKADRHSPGTQTRLSLRSSRMWVRDPGAWPQRLVWVTNFGMQTLGPRAAKVYPMKSIGGSTLFIDERSISVSSKVLPTVKGDSVVYIHSGHPYLAQYHLSSGSLSPAIDNCSFYGRTPGPSSLVHHVFSCSIRNQWCVGVFTLFSFCTVSL